MASELGKLRRSQAVTMYGPGAIVDFRVGGRRGAPVSVVIAGLEQWDQIAPPPGLLNRQKTFEPRLQEHLKVEGFRLPPVTPQRPPWLKPARDKSLVGARFPRWLHCPKCHLLQLESRWGKSPGEAERYCAFCTKPGKKLYAVPVRFVAACVKGHLEEFPWHFWVNHAEDCKNDAAKKDGRSEYRLAQDPKRAGLAGLVLKCETCGSSRPMEGCFSEDALDGVKRHGKRPWLAEADEDNCTEPLRGLQRGASNVYFPVTASALSIPPWSDKIESELAEYWSDLAEAAAGGELEDFIRLNKLPKKLGVSQEKIIERVQGALERLADTGPHRLRWEEYLQFVEAKRPRVDAEPTEFEVRHEIVPPELAKSFDLIARATRLREVRALCAFTRINPPSPEPGDVAHHAAIQKNKANWLPAIEVRGEGIFLRLHGERLKAWEQQPAVIERAKRIDDAYKHEWTVRYGKAARLPSRTITARFVLIHSLAHAVIRQLSLECGYSAAALRERLYVGHGEQDMAALLIYTGTTDSDGTLGGLARQGKPGRIAEVVEGALRSLEWCSSDPLCMRGMNSFTEPLNLAACHSCMLVPETSCEEFNRLLDRAMLVGAVDAKGIGFFGDFASGAR